MGHSSSKDGLDEAYGDTLKKLKSFNVGDLLSSESWLLVDFKQTDTVSSVLSKLAEFGYTGGPISTNGESSPDFQFIELLDIAAFLLTHIGKDGTIPAAVFDKTITEVGTFTLREPVFSIDHEQPLEKALEKMNSLSVHRLVVTKKEGGYGDEPEEHGVTIIGIITQSSIIRWIHNHSAILRKKKEATIKELHLGYKDVICIEPKDSVLEAVKIMYEKNIGSVGVVSDGVLLDSFSTSHLKGLTKENASKLLLSFEDFRSSFPSTERHGTVHEDSSFVLVMELMAKNKLHRTFIVNTKGICVGVITLTDILSELCGAKE